MLLTESSKFVSVYSADALTVSVHTLVRVGAAAGGVVRRHGQGQAPRAMRGLLCEL